MDVRYCEGVQSARSRNIQLMKADPNYRPYTVEKHVQTALDPESLVIVAPSSGCMFGNEMQTLTQNMESFKSDYDLSAIAEHKEGEHVEQKVGEESRCRVLQTVPFYNRAKEEARLKQCRLADYNPFPHEDVAGEFREYTCTAVKRRQNAAEEEEQQPLRRSARLQNKQA